MKTKIDEIENLFIFKELNKVLDKLTWYKIPGTNGVSPNMQIFG